MLVIATCREEITGLEPTDKVEVVECLNGHPALFRYRIISESPNHSHHPTGVRDHKLDFTGGCNGPVIES
ncbi:hypothetical protein D3C77_232610 [compost metagenome]